MWVLDTLILSRTYNWLKDHTSWALVKLEWRLKVFPRTFDLCFEIHRTKVHSLVQNTFSRTFQTFFSLSNLARLHRDFFVVFLQIFCKVSLSLSRYVYITLPFALFFSFACTLSWFLDNFWTMLNLGFLINQALFYEFDQWVLLLQWCIHDLYWLIWSIQALWKIKNSRACIVPELGILLKLILIDEIGLLNWCNWSLFYVIYLMWWSIGQFVTNCSSGFSNFWGFC